MNILGVEVERIKGEKYILLRLRYKRGLFFRIKKIIKNYINIINLNLKESNNIFCPECGEKIDYYKEVVYLRKFKVNFRSGLITSKAQKINYKIEFNGREDGFSCRNPYCYWTYEYFHGESEGKDMIEEIKKIIKEEKLKIDGE